MANPKQFVSAMVIGQDMIHPLPGEQTRQNLKQYMLATGAEKAVVNFGHNRLLYKFDACGALFPSKEWKPIKSL